MKRSGTNTVKTRKRKRVASQKKAKPSNGATADWIEKYAADPEEVRAFCARHRLFDAGRVTLKLAREVYEPRAIQLGIEGDPEGSSEWLVVDVDVRKTVDQLLDARDRFVEQWIDMLPVSKVLLIRVLSHIV